jgi:hypothetical protein
MKILPIAPLLALASVAAAQTILPLPARGMMTAQSAGLVFENDLQRVVMKGPGLPARLDRVESVTNRGVPNYSTAAIATYLANLTSVFVDVEIDAMSTGNDLLPLIFVPGTTTSPPAFRVAVPTPGTAWATLSIVRQVPGQNVGSDILGYYFDNPSFPYQLRNTVVHEAVRSDFLPVGFDPAGANIAALDYAMGQINASNGRPEAAVIECTNRLYFSVTPICASAIDALNVIPQGVDAATILMATYDASGAVYDLEWVGRPPGSVDLDIDALGAARVHSPILSTVPGAVQVETGSTMFLLSFTETSGFEELLAYAAPDFNPTGLDTMRLAPLRWTNGNPMIGTEQIPGRVKGICSRDPDWNVGARSFGVPFMDSFNSGPVLSLEVANPDTQMPTDLFKVRGVVGGAAYPGASVFLAVGHDGGYLFYPLGMWPGSQGQFSFECELNYKWQNHSGGSGPGPGLTCTNFYEMMVVTISPVPGLGAYGLSTTCWLRRQDYD